jgi:hypothetical protein
LVEFQTERLRLHADVKFMRCIPGVPTLLRWDLAPMNLATTADDQEKPCDRTALMMMLAYVEAECRRIGAEAAAEHAAMAAALVPGRTPNPPPLGLAVH